MCAAHHRRLGSLVRQHVGERARLPADIRDRLVDGRRRQARVHRQPVRRAPRPKVRIRLRVAVAAEGLDVLLAPQHEVLQHLVLERRRVAEHSPPRLLPLLVGGIGEVLPTGRLLRKHFSLHCPRRKQRQNQQRNENPVRPTSSLKVDGPPLRFMRPDPAEELPREPRVACM